MVHAQWRQILCRVCAAAMVLNTLAVTGLADTIPGGFSAKGTVAEPARISLAVPVGGRIEEMGWRAGDAVDAEQLAFSVAPAQVLAASDGTIRGLRAQVGDQAANVAAVFGALCHIERDTVWQVNASATSAYDRPENRDVRVGDTLRIQQGYGSSEIVGTGEVIRLEPRAFLVELPVGDFTLEEKVTLYLEAGQALRREAQVGNGKIARAPAIPVQGDGCIAAVHVTEGQRVVRGQVLFTLDAASAKHEGTPDTDVFFPLPGAIAEVLAQPGQAVAQGQVALTLIPLPPTEIAFDVDELDIAGVYQGQRVRVVLDAYAAQERMGTVREIQPLGSIVQDITRFTVIVAVDDAGGLMRGMHAEGYFVP